ncbi:beta-lactamase-like protein [Exophiala viscosa]|uniref:Beta-lactamase-like protein n=1 Tax=Exophiala viscosa TaxID=2486360 RepID=A0AAN6IJH5_9EURO|nr:beta-lactamase-like protein [Exophiala viscosa]
MATVTAHALGAGHLTIPERFFVKPADPDARRTVPSLSFLVQHKDARSGKTTRIVFDLGMRRDLSLYPAALESHLTSRQPISTDPDPVASLAIGGLSVDDIDYVMFSHVHYDHVGMPRDFTNKKTKFIVGHGALDLLNGKTKHDLGKHMVFESDLLPLERTIELPPPEVSDNPSPNHAQFKWKRLGPFPEAIDFFNDGSLYIVNSPGHLPGHINLLCRLSSTKFIIMAGDACHDVRLLTGERDIATWTDETGKHCCIHVDIPTAKENLARLRAVTKDGIEVDGEAARAQVELVFAHDFAWEEDAVKRGRFWPGKVQ